MLLICFSFLGGCGFKALTGGPNLNDAVTGNGSLSVQKGDYLYFVNGFVSTEDLVEGDNVYNEVDNSAIYRVKLTNNELSYDEDELLLNAQLLIPKVVGFENAGIYIFDNYIYYTTPNTEKGENGTVDFGLIDFYRAKLNGTDVTRIYKTDTTSDSTSFAFYKIGTNVYLTVFDGSKIVVVNTVNKNVTTISEDVSSAVLPNVTTYNALNNTITENESYVYYTRTAKEDENINYGNVLAKAKISVGTEIIIKRDNYNTFTVQSFNSDAIYYTKKSQIQANAYWYLCEFEDAELDFNTEKQLSFMSYSSKVLTPNFENGFERGLITLNSQNYLVWVRNINDVPNVTILYDADTVTLMYVQGDDVFCYDSNYLMLKINFKTKAVIQLTNSEDVTPNLTMKTNFDYDSDYLYFYNTYKNDDYTSYYLVRICTLGNSDHTVELVGKIEEIHLTEEDEE